jgi:large subunit ribosomal protein L22
MDAEESTKAVSNWMKGFYKPRPKSSDVERIASALGVEATEISDYPACLRYAPTSPRKARLVAEMIRGRHIQDALDVLRFCHKRPSSMFSKLLKSAVANADEQQADVERLYVSEARVDGAGRRVGTKRWIPKDRGRAHPIRKEASHLHVVLAELEE